MTKMSTTSLASTGRRPSELHVDSGCTTSISADTVDRLLADIAFQRQRERRQRVDNSGRWRTRKRCDKREVTGKY